MLLRGQANLVRGGEKVWGNLSVNVEYDIRYNSQPAAGRKELDTTFIFGLSYEIKS